MSGIVAVFHADGAPVDVAHLSRLVAALRSHGPDGEGQWSAGEVGLGCAALHVFDDGGDRGQPAALDNRFWIVADARIDGQAELRSSLGVDSRRLTDAELILHAYRHWGIDCLGHLIGDFAFLLWDAEQRRLLAARDRVGVRQLYWVRSGNALLVSNAFELLAAESARQTPDRSAFISFLEHGYLENESATCLEEVKQLPLATALLADDSGVQVRRYWTPPPAPPQRHCRDEDRVEEFAGHLRAAVRDRLRHRRLTISMSGGLDSTSLAALAREEGAEILAVTWAWHPLVPDDEEERLARMTAARLGIPIAGVTDPGDRLLADTGSPSALALPPWPLWDAFAAPHRRFAHRAWSHSRAVWSGFDGDAAFGLSSVTAALAASRDPFQMADGIGNYLLYERSLPAARVARNWWAARRGPQPTTGFVRPELRAERRHPGEREWPFWGSFWGALMQQHEFHWGPPLQYSHPLTDVRLVQFSRGLPEVPWRVQKRILREVMRGKLPEEVRTRPKCPMPADPIEVEFQRQGLPELPRETVHPLLREIVDWEVLEQARCNRPPGASWGIVAVHLAQKWLSLLD